MTMAHVYLVTNTINSKVYIGKAVDVRQRWRHHKYQASHGHQTSIHRAIRKYGADAFVVTTLVACRTEEDAYECEQVLIRQYDSRRGGYNRTDGGAGTIAVNVSKATRAKMRDRAMGRPPVSLETKAKLSALMRGRTITWGDKISAAKRGRTSDAIKVASRVTGKANIGRKHTADAIEKIRAAGRRACSPETRAKIAAAHMGRKRSPESIANMAATKRGVPQTKEHIAKRSAAMKASWARRKGIIDDLSEDSRWRIRCGEQAPQQRDDSIRRQRE